MFVVEVGAAFTTVLAVVEPSAFAWSITVWLWLTVVFATLAESVAEGRGKAQAASLRATQRETTARKVVGSGTAEVPSSSLQVGDVVVVVAGETIPGDGDVIEGVASVDESAITGESAPVIRESGGDRSAVTGGTVVLSDRIVVRITAPAGHTFVDRMIALVEGSERQKTPNEVALNVLLTTLTIVFLLAVVTLQPFAVYSGAPQTLIVLVALLVCLIPTTIGALLSAIGIAGMDRLVRRNVLAMSGRAVEAAGDCRRAAARQDRAPSRSATGRPRTCSPPPGSTRRSSRTPPSCRRWPTRRRRGARSWCWSRSGSGSASAPEGDLVGAELVPFQARTRMSGVDLPAAADRPARVGPQGRRRGGHPLGPVHGRPRG